MCLRRSHFHKTVSCGECLRCVCVCVCARAVENACGTSVCAIVRCEVYTCMCTQKACINGSLFNYCAGGHYSAHYSYLYQRGKLTVSTLNTIATHMNTSYNAYMHCHAVC